MKAAQNVSTPPYEYIGCLHVHTTYSDGAGSVADVAAAARRAAIDFVVINDHAHMCRALNRENEGFYDGVFVMMDLEVGIRHHHYLAFDCRRMPRWDLAGGQEIIDEVQAAGGFGFLAHPFEKGMPLEGYVAYTWKDLDVRGFTGICIWNFSSRWKERIAGVASGLLFILFKSGFLKGPSARTMAFWDRSCARSRVVAAGGADAHHKRYGFGPFRIRPLTYDYLLGAITVHLLSDMPFPNEPDEARNLVCRALKEGSLFVANDKIRASKGFRFYFEPDQGARCHMGEEAVFSPGEMTVALPFEGETRLFRDGILVETSRGISLRRKVNSPGVYRVEVYRRAGLFGMRPWIFSNPIYLRPAQTAAE
jgi:hypothetical protein